MLRAVQVVVDEGLAKPILIGRPRRDRERDRRSLGLRLQPGTDFELVDPENDPATARMPTSYHELTRAQRRVTPTRRGSLMRSNTTLIGAMLVRRGEADAMLCGT